MATSSVSLPTCEATRSLGDPVAVLRACPMCETDNRWRPANCYSRLPWALKDCAKCGFTYLENPPGYAALEEEYAWEKTSAFESQSRRQREPLLHRLGAAGRTVRQGLLRPQKVLRLVRRYVEAGRLLDVGCGTGRVGVLAGPAYVPFGIEISRRLAESADRYFRALGGRVVHAPALEGLATFGEEFFDGVVMKAYLEHEIAPRQVLVATCRAMRPRSALIVKVPNYASLNRRARGSRWCGFRHPDHVNYFTPRAIVRLLEGSGFEILRFGLMDRLPTSDNLWIVARKARQGIVLSARF